MTLRRDRDPIFVKRFIQEDNDGLETWSLRVECASLHELEETRATLKALVSKVFNEGSSHQLVAEFPPPTGAHLSALAQAVVGSGGWLNIRAPRIPRRIRARLGTPL